MTKYLTPFLSQEQSRSYANILAYSFPGLLEVTGDARMRKATCLARTHVRYNELPGHYEVESLSHFNHFHLVIPKDRSCTCKRSLSGKMCEHRVAVAIRTLAVELLRELTIQDYKLAGEVAAGRY